MAQSAPKVIEFTSHVYIASVLLKQGVENADDKIKKYGLLDQSLEFQYLKPSQNSQAEQLDVRPQLQAVD